MALAFIGILLPVLPTTPFLLLAAFLFARGSPRLQHWLESNRLFGAYIHNYRSGKGMTLRSKIISIGGLWLLIGITFFISNLIWLKVILVLVAIGVTTHLVRVRVYRPDRE